MKFMIYILFFLIFLILIGCAFAVLLRSIGFLVSSFMFMVSKLPIRKHTELVQIVKENVDKHSDEMESIEIIGGDNNDI